MTTTTTAETSSSNPRSARSCGPRGCGPAGYGPRFGGPFAGPFSGPFAGPYGPHFAARFGGGWRQAPVNIEETADAYILSLYAAGLDKNHIHVSAQGDVLRIRYEAAPAEDGTRTFTRRERPHSSFEREFALNAKVQVDAITASYSEGVLTVHLPLTPEAKRPEHQVPVQ
ncbi:MAG: Hsp20/alpha crystallin family protein [Rhodoferax sp.]|nr:Hsp20/alpha crystallin family protein [Rhodoferax sp.]